MTDLYHIRLRLKGPKDKQDLFHRIMKHLDRDWPWSPNSTRGKCAQCGGYFYGSPLLTARDIKNLARQVGVRKLVVEYYLPEKICRKRATATGGSIFGTATAGTN